MSVSEDAITIIEDFQKQSGEIFFTLADVLPVLMDEVDKELAVWKVGKKDGVFEKIDSSYSLMQDFIKKTCDEDGELLERTHNNLGLMNYTTKENQVPTRPAEFVLNVLLRNAERNFVELITRSSAMFDTIEESYSSAIPLAKEPVYQMYSDFKWLSDEIKILNKPIFTVMEAIQTQDIMRQSLDHVIKSLKEIDFEKFDEPLEDITFKINLFEFSLLVVEEVKDMLVEVQGLFFEQLEKFEAELKRLMNKKKDLLANSKIDEAKSQINSNLNNVESVLRTAEDCYVDYLKSKAEILKIHADVLKKAKSFFKDDISKQAGEEAEKVVVDETIDSEFLHACEKIDIVLNRTSDYTTIEGDLILSLAELKNIYGVMSTVILNKEFGGVEFKKGFTDFTDLVIKTNFLVGELSNTYKAINEIAERLKKEKEDILKERGLSEWVLKTNKIQEMASTFTIASHKRMISQVSGLTFDDLITEGLDSKEDSGDFIMF